MLPLGNGGIMANEKEVGQVNGKLYLEYLKFKDEMLRTTHEEIFANCYRIDIILNLYNIMLELTAKLPEAVLRNLEGQEGMLDYLYHGWIKTPDSTYQELSNFVESRLPYLTGQCKTG